jgi:acetyl esterase/lipase
MLRKRQKLILPAALVLIIITMSNSPNIFTQPFSITWRKALLSAPRLVPNAALYLTSSEGPQPIIIDLPSRGKHQIPLYVFIPPSKPSSTPSSKLSPQTETEKEKVKVPVLLDFHGGGFIFGSCKEQAPFCSKMARELGTISISVDYRLGPAAKFPAANEDAEDVLSCILNPSSPSHIALLSSINSYLRKERRPEISIDNERIAISGFSSGGNLALNLGLSVTPTEEPGKGIEWPSPFPSTFRRRIPLLLFFPSLDCRQLPHERPRPAIMEEQKKTFLKSLELEATLMPTYLPRSQAGHPRASPGLADIRDEGKGGLHGKAKMLLVLPEMDTLAEQSEVWVEKVGAEGKGGDLRVERVRGVLHGWTQFPDSWLKEEDRRAKGEMFDKAREFVESAWESE